MSSKTILSGEFSGSNIIEKKNIQDYNITMKKDKFDYRQRIIFINRRLELKFLEDILYFDPTLAVYYPQGKSYGWGIKLYFENIT